MLTKQTAHNKDRSTALRGVKMEHRHFSAIAWIIRQYDSPERLAIAVHFARELRGTNPRFDRDRFLAAILN